MFRHRRILIAGALSLTLLAASAFPSIAQDATPTTASQGLTLAAGGIIVPAGFAWAPDGTLYVAESTEVAPMHHGGTPAATQPSGSLDGAIVRIADGCPVVYQGNLPSSGTPDGSTVGPAGLVWLDGQLYMLDEGGGPDRGNPMTPDGIYRIPGDGSIPLVADVHSWVGDNPVANPSENPESSDVTGMVAHDDAFLVLESDQGQVLRITTAGEITRYADLSAEGVQPRGIVTTPAGDALIGLGSRIVSIDAEGQISDQWTGLDQVIDIAVAANGTVYALEANGTVLRQSGDGSREVATGFSNPASMAFGTAGQLYVSTTPDGAPQAGGVVRIDIDQGQVMTMSDSLLTQSACVVQPTPEVPATAADDATPNPDEGTPATPNGGDDDDAAGGGSTVEISNFSFSPDSLSVSAGTTVTWVNNDSTAHTVTAADGSFDSGNLAPGESFTFTFSEAGSFDYYCMYHPNMEATVVVE